MLNVVQRAQQMRDLGALGGHRKAESSLYKCF